MRAVNYELRRKKRLANDNLRKHIAKLKEIEKRIEAITKKHR